MVTISKEIFWYGKVLLIAFIFNFAVLNIIDGPVWANGGVDDSMLSEVLLSRPAVVLYITIMAIIGFVWHRRRNVGHRQVSTLYWEAAEAILSDRHVRLELKKAIKSLDHLRPIDALQDAAALYNLQQIRAKETRRI